MMKKNKNVITGKAGKTRHMLKTKYFDLQLSIVMVLVNTVIVGLINWDLQGGASRSALIQAVLTFGVIGLIMPRIRYAATSNSIWYAYGIGAIVFPTIALSIATYAHWFLGTVNMQGTFLYLVVSTAVASLLFIFLKRNLKIFPSFLRSFLSWL